MHKNRWNSAEKKEGKERKAERREKGKQDGGERKNLFEENNVISYNTLMSQLRNCYCIASKIERNDSTQHLSTEVI